jgi:arylformamidase
MKIHDVSLTIDAKLPTWPSDPGFKLERTSKIEEGANANVSRLEMGVHTGTHVDAPVHFVPGAPGVETLSLQTLIGPARVMSLPDAVDVIDLDVLTSLEWPEGTERVLFKTRNSKYWAAGDSQFHTEFVAIADDAAHFLVEKGVKLVGVDYLSVAPWKKSKATHQTLLNARVIVIEGLDLSGVEAGTYQLYCLPVKLGGSDGAPTRVVLVEE